MSCGILAQPRRFIKQVWPSRQRAGIHFNVNPRGSVSSAGQGSACRPARLATFLLLVFCGCLSSVAALAQSPQPGGWSVGVGAVASSRPYPGSSSDVTPIPFLGYEGRRAYLRGLVAGLRQAGPGESEFDVFVRARMQRYSSSDSPAVAGMDDRRRTAEAGVGLQVGPRWLRGRAQLARDVLGRHDGEELTLTASFPVFLRGTLISFIGGGSWQSSDLTSYYYGVRADEATATRPAYRPGAAWNWRAGVMMRRNLGPRWNAMLILQHEWLDSNLQDSPIVDGGRRWFGLVGASYGF